MQTISAEEEAKAKKFIFIKDARLSLGSSLLKRLFIVRTLAVPWPDVQFSRIGHEKHGKPCYAPDAQAPTVDFNISHQAGLVALVGCSAADALIGVDITCVNERNEKRMLEKEGFEGFVDMHEEVFSPADLKAIKAATGSLDDKIRTFYAYWALKEAYVKLEGEALLAKWLQETEFRNVQVPQPMSKKELESSTSAMPPIEVWFRGQKENNVELFLAPFEDNYLIATAAKKPEGSKFTSLPTMKVLDLDEDILPFAD